MSTQERLRFWRENEYAAKALIAEAGTTDDIVIVIADARDPLGRDLALASSAKHGVDFEDHERKMIAKGQIPTVVFGVSVAIASKLMSISSPSVSQKLDTAPSLPEGLAFVLIISSGGSTLIVAPVEPQKTVGTS
jgi:hypothetical protein